MLLEHKTAVIYGAGGWIGGAVARAFAREGARVFLTGRTLAKLDAVAAEIAAAGCAVRTAQLDALDKDAVDAHAAAVAGEAGGIDIAFSAVSPEHVHGKELVDLPFDDFDAPISVGLRSLYLTATAASRHMVGRGSGVILAPIGPSRDTSPTMGGTVVSWAATQALCRQLAAELGPHGVRVVWVQTPGSPEPIPETVEFGGGMTRDEIIAMIERRTLLNRLPSLAELANVAAFLASDHAASMTATGANITAGGAVD
jgi:3-oxoacyl-[acyl-carrier protein] reductase